MCAIVASIVEQCSLLLPLPRGAGPMALMLWLDGMMMTDGIMMTRTRNASWQRSQVARSQYLPFITSLLGKHRRFSQHSPS
jgi:hypothetical protein